MTDHVKRERSLMLGCSSPWLVNMLATVKDRDNLYMVLEAVLGGELFGYMQV